MRVRGERFFQLLKPSVAQICKLFSATKSVENASVLFPLEGSERILLPSIQHDPVLHIQDSVEGSGKIFESTIFAQPTLVSVLKGDGGGDTPASLFERGSSYIPNGGVASSTQELINQTNRMDDLRSDLESRGLPKNVIELLLGAARLNTQSPYQSAWDAWCTKRSVHSMSATVNDVLSFLFENFAEKKSYSTLSKARSMLSSTLCLGPNNIADIGKDPLVVKLMKGIHNQTFRR